MTHPNIGVMLVTKFVRALGTTVTVFCRLCTNPSGYKLGRHKSYSTLDSSIIYKNPRQSLMVQHHETKMIIRVSENLKVKVESVSMEEDLEGDGVKEDGNG